jgi:hypothetical protein
VAFATLTSVLDVVVEPHQHSIRREQVRPKCSCSLDVADPSIALSRVCYLSGCILRSFDLLTLASLLTAVACWYRDFPHDGCMSPSRLTGLHGAYRSSSAAPPAGCGQ